MFNAAEAMNHMFKFKIGDIVVLATVLEALRFEAKHNKRRSHDRIGHPATTMQIVERWAQQCHGGVQFFYGVRAWKADGSMTMLERMAEMELAPLVDAQTALLEMQVEK